MSQNIVTQEKFLKKCPSKHYFQYGHRHERRRSHRDVDRRGHSRDSRRTYRVAQ